MQVKSSATLNLIKSPHFVQMIQSIKFTSLFWHSWDATGSKEDLKTKIELPLLSEHPLRRPSETQKQRRAPQWLNGSSLCDPLHLHKGPSPCLSRKRFNGWRGGGVVVGDHAVTFTVLKTAYCCPLPKVLLWKTFFELLGPGCSLQIRGAGKCWQVAPAHTYSTCDGEAGVVWIEELQQFLCHSWGNLSCLLGSFVSLFLCPSLIDSTVWCGIFPNLVKQRRKHGAEKGLAPCSALWLMASPHKHSDNSDRFPDTHRKPSPPPPLREDQRSIVLRVVMVPDGGRSSQRRFTSRLMNGLCTQYK